MTAKRKIKWARMWEKEEILKLKTSKEVIQALDENPWRIDLDTYKYKRELALKEREAKYGEGNFLLWLIDKKND